MIFKKKKRLQKVMGKQKQQKEISALRTYCEFLDDLETLFSTTSTLFSNEELIDNIKNDRINGIKTMRNKWNLIMKMKRNYNFIFKENLKLKKFFNQILDDMDKIIIEDKFTNLNIPIIIFTEINNLIELIKKAKEGIKNLIVEYTKKLE